MTMDPWNVVFLAGFLAYATIRGVYESRTKGVERVDTRMADARDRALVGAMVVGGLVLPVLYLATPWLDFADYRLPAALPWLGAAVMAIALWLFWRSHADLGLNWSPTLAIRKDHELVTHGVYRHLRHPMYAAIWLFSLAQGLLLQNWLAGWSAVAAFALMYFARVPREERLMQEAFGDEYARYALRTGRVFPRLKQ
jgi:protein-S-isoprenylcysteine O-methyltransferase Ste14